MELIQAIVSFLGPTAVVIIALAIIILPAALKVLPDWERAVVLRLGKFQRTTGPGIIFLIPYVDRALRVDTRIVTMDVPRQEMMSRDNVPITVDAIVLFKVIDPRKSILNIENFVRTTSLIAQTTLRSTIGQAELDELLSQRDQINQKLQSVIDEQTEPFGVKVTAVEVRDVVLPETMKRAMAAQAERLAQAANVISREPAALQLRYLQSMREIASERSSITILPLPLEIFTPFLESMRRKTDN
jgi:regulator of protease activity HflC (stomatin/prohibitin superfamily)